MTGENKTNAGNTITTYLPDGTYVYGCPPLTIDPFPQHPYIISMPSVSDSEILRLLRAEIEVLKAKLETINEKLNRLLDRKDQKDEKV